MQLNRFVAGNFSRDTNRDYFTLLEKYYEEEKKKKKKKKKKGKERDVSEHHAVPPEVINPCGKEWNAGDLAYRCRDCQKTNSSSVCVSCFKESDHVGHDFTIYRSEAGGVCDCGDRESWAVAGSCARHGGKCNKDEEEEEERDEEVEGEREEEKKEVWDSTSVNGLLRVRKKERRMNGKDLFMEYWLKDPRRKYRTAIAIDIAVKRLVLAVKNSRRLKIRYAELTRTVRFQEDANSSFGESGPMNRSDGMLFTKKERRYVEKKVAPYVVSNDKFPLCFFDDETPAQTEELEQRSRRMAFRSANNRAMLLNERVPRAVLEQLEEMSVASSVLATYHGDENGSGADDADQKVQLDPELEDILTPDARARKLDNMRDEYRVVVERIRIERTAARVIAGWLLHQFANSDIVELKECLAMAFISSSHSKYAREESRLTDPDMDWKTRMRMSKVLLKNGCENPDGHLSNIEYELKTTKSVRQMWQDVAHVHTEIDDSIEEWLEDVSIRTRAHNEDVDEMKSENYKNWGGKKWKNCWYRTEEYSTDQIKVDCTNSLFVIMHEMSETPEAEVFSDIVSIFLKLIVSSAFVQMHYSAGKSESYGQNRFKCHVDFESLGEFRTRFFKVYMHLYFDLSHIGFMFPWSSLKPSLSSECYRGRRKFDRIRGDLLDRLGVQLFASWSLFLAVNDSYRYPFDQIQRDAVNHKTDGISKYLDMFSTHRRLLWSVKAFVDEDLRNLLNNPTWHVDQSEESEWEEYKRSNMFLGLANRPISDLRNFALNSTLNAINFVNSKVLLLEFFEEMFMFCSEKVEPVIRAHKQHVGRENEEWLNIVALEFNLVLVYKDIIRKALLDSSSDENDDIDISLGDGGISARRNACAENLRLHVVLKFLKARIVDSCKRMHTKGVVGSRNELDSRNPHAPHLRCLDITIQALYDYYSRNPVAEPSFNAKEIITHTCEELFRNNAFDLLQDDINLKHMFNHDTVLDVHDRMAYSFEGKMINQSRGMNCSEIIALRISDILHWSFQVNARAWILNGDQMRLYSRTYSIGTFKFVSKFCDISLLEKVLTFSPRKSILFAVEIFLLRAADVRFRWVDYGFTYRSLVEFAERCVAKGKECPEYLRKPHIFEEMKQSLLTSGPDELLESEKAVLCLRDAMNTLAYFATRQSQSLFCIETESERVENSIIHTVAFKESMRNGPTYSNIQSGLSVYLGESFNSGGTEKDLDDYLERLCIVSKPSTSTMLQPESNAFSMQVTYKLKEESWAKFNAFHIDYTDEERDAAKANAIQRNSDWTPINEACTRTDEDMHCSFKFRFSVSPVVAFVCSLSIRLSAFNEDQNPIYDDLAVAAFAILDDAMRSISSQFTTSSRSNLLKRFQGAVDSYSTNEVMSTEDEEVLSKLKNYVKACDTYFNEDLETLKDGFNSSTVELFSRIKDNEQHSGSKFETDVPEIPEEIRESEIEFIQNWSRVWREYASTKRECVEFIKYLNNESFEKPCCSELGSDSLDLLIEELKKMVAIWKEKNQAARTLRNGSTFCEAVYLLATREKKIKSNEDILRRTAIKVAKRMRKNDNLCLLDVQTYNDIAHRTGAFARDGSLPSSSNERERDGNFGDKETVKQERKARLKARQEQMMKEMREQQRKASQALGISDDVNNEEENGAANTFPSPSSSSVCDVCAGCGNPIKDDDFDACLISKFMLVNHADVLKRNEFDRRMKQNGAKYDPGTLAERKSRYDDEFAQMAGHITRDTCLSVETGGLIAQSCGHKMHLKCLRNHKIATGAQEPGQGEILKEMQASVFVEGANVFENNETNTNANGQSQSQNEATNRVNAAILEDGALENPDDIIAEQQREQLRLEENTLRANGEERRRQVFIRRENGLVNGQFHCPTCRRISDCAIPILEDMSKSSTKSVDVSGMCRMERALLERELVESIFWNLANADYGGTLRLASLLSYARKFVFLHPHMQHADKLDIDACIKNAISGFQYDGKSDNLKYNCSTVEDLTLLTTRRDYNALWKSAIAGICFCELALRPALSLTVPTYAEHAPERDALPAVGDEVNNISIDATWLASISIAKLAFAFMNYSSRASSVILHHNPIFMKEENDVGLVGSNRFTLYMTLLRLDLLKEPGFSSLFSKEEKAKSEEILKEMKDSIYLLMDNSRSHLSQFESVVQSGAMEVMHFPSSHQTKRYRKINSSLVVKGYLAGESVRTLKMTRPDEGERFIPDTEKWEENGMDPFLEFVHTMLWCFETIRHDFSKTEGVPYDPNNPPREPWPPQKFLDEKDIELFLTRLRETILANFASCNFITDDDKREKIYFLRSDLEYFCSLHFRMGALIDAAKRVWTTTSDETAGETSGRIKMPRTYDAEGIDCILSRALSSVSGSETHPEITVISANEASEICGISRTADPNTLKMPSLIKPPKRHEDLLLASKVPCKCCQRIPEVAAMCLLCGDIFCAADELCVPKLCTTGTEPNAWNDPNTDECNLTPFDAVTRNINYTRTRHKGEWGLYKHARHCGQRTCVFILPQLTKTLILDDQYARLCPSLYVDAHGEEDENCQRGVQLFLVEERFKIIDNAWRTGALVFQGGSSPMLKGQRSMATQW